MGALVDVWLLYHTHTSYMQDQLRAEQLARCKYDSVSMLVTRVTRAQRILTQSLAILTPVRSALVLWTRQRFCKARPKNIIFVVMRTNPDMNAVSISFCMLFQFDSHIPKGPPSPLLEKLPYRGFQQLNAPVWAAP